MRINYNVSAMLANNALGNNDSLLSKSIERLSSGLKINNAKDNPAGLAMAKRMNAQIKGSQMANENSNDGISVIETADGAMSEIAEMLGRLTELSTKAANGTMKDDDRKLIQDEVDQLKSEITRISEATEFNSQPLLNGGFDLKAYTNSNDYKVTTYSQEVETGKYEGLNLEWEISADREVSVNITSIGKGFKGENDSEYTNLDYKASMTDNIIKIEGPEGFMMQISVPENEGIEWDKTEGNEGKYIAKSGSITGLSIDCTGIGTMRLQVGSNEGQTMDVAIPAVSLENLGLKGMDVSTEEGANEAMDRISKAVNTLSSMRGKLGAYQNRLENTVDRLDITDENMTAAYSRIMDVDMAEEMTEYSTFTVVSQAGISVLAQANDRPSQVLQLLQ